MKFCSTCIDDLYLVEFDKFYDNRGAFSNIFSGGIFENSEAQSCVSWNPQAATLRGLHFQREPYAQSKLVSCLAGRAYDVVVDLRESSKTFKAWFAVELDPTGFRGLLIPKGFAHGFLTLDAETIIHYTISGSRNVSSEDGIRWDDPAIGIIWPIMPKIISNKDKNHPLL